MTSLMTLNQHKIENYVIIASLKSETIGKLINRILGDCLLISSLPGSKLLTAGMDLFTKNQLSWFQIFTFLLPFLVCHKIK